MKLQDARRKIVCAIDTGDVTKAVSLVKRLQNFAGAFKIGHALTLGHGLDVIKTLQDAGAERIFLDLKFHDIPNVVGLAVREAARYKVWMTTLHLSGGPAMITAAVEEALECEPGEAPLLMGVSVLTSLTETDLREHLAINRSLTDHMVELSKMGIECGLDGVVCSVHEAPILRESLGRSIILTPGIRPKGAATQDQSRTDDAAASIQAGADYMVIGRALTGASDPHQALLDLGFELD